MPDRIWFLFLVALQLSLLAAAEITPAESSPQESREEIRQIERRLSQEKEQLRKVGGQEKDILARLARLEKEVAEKKGEIEDLNRKIRQASVEHNELKRNLNKLRQLVTESQEKISKKLVMFYKQMRIGYLNAFADVPDITGFQRRLKYLTLLIAHDKADLIRTTEKAKALQERASQTEGRMKEIKQTTRNEEARLTSLNKELEERVLLLVKVNQEKKFYETSVKELESAAEGLRQALVDIEKKEPHEADRACHFADFKGKLPYPMRGRVLKGQALHPHWDPSGTSRGIVIEGAQDSEVKAVFQGTVAFSGQLKGYGELIIVNHGSRFFTVSANLSERIKMKGDRVKEGEIIGRVGANGAGRRGRLYFEIREGGQGLNPQEWLRPQ